MCFGDTGRVVCGIGRCLTLGEERQDPCWQWTLFTFLSPQFCFVFFWRGGGWWGSCSPWSRKHTVWGARREALIAHHANFHFLFLKKRSSARKEHKLHTKKEEPFLLPCLYCLADLPFPARLPGHNDSAANNEMCFPVLCSPFRVCLGNLSLFIRYWYRFVHCLPFERLAPFFVSHEEQSITNCSKALLLR